MADTAADTALNVEVVRGIPEQHRAQAAALYATAFRQKFLPIFGGEARTAAVLERSLDLAYAVGAVAADRLVGIAGYKDAHGSLVDIQPRQMTETFGLVSGWLRLLALGIFSRPVQPGTLLMDGIAVDAEARGGGIGTRLLEALVDLARTRGYGQIRLDVVDTNPRARQLYERRGFVATRSQHTPYLRRLFGFSGSTTMVKTLTETG